MKRIVYLFSISLLLLSGCDKSIGPSDTNPELWTELQGIPWPMAHHDPQFTGNSPYAGPTQGIIEWRVDTDGEVWGLALGADGTVYFGTDRHGVADAAFSAVTSIGATLWKQFLPGFVTSVPLLTNSGNVYLSVNKLAYDTAYVARFTANGIQEWRSHIQPYLGAWAPWSSLIPSADGELLYCVSASDSATHLQSISRTGVVTTLFTAGADSALTRGSPSISQDGRTLYLPGKKGIYAVSTTGKLLWRYRSSYPASTPTVDSDGYLYFVSDGIVSLTESGIVRWKNGTYRFNIYPLHASISRDGLLFVVPDYLDFRLVILTRDGSLVTEVMTTNAISSSPVTDVNGTVYLCTVSFPQWGDSSNVCAYDRDGSLKFKLTLRNPDGKVPDISASPVIAPDGSMYLAAENPSGGLFKIR